MYRFPTVKSALLFYILFYLFCIIFLVLYLHLLKIMQILYQDPVLLFCKLVLASKIEFNCNQCKLRLEKPLQKP